MKTIKTHCKDFIKRRSKSKALPNCTARYCESIKLLFDQLSEHKIHFTTEYQTNITRHWRFDFLIFEKQILIQLPGGPWSPYRSRRHDLSFYIERENDAIEKGFKILSFQHSAVENGEALKQILEILRDEQHETTSAAISAAKPY